MKSVYITSAGLCLPNSAIDNEEIEDYLGKINGESSTAKHRVLKQNGIRTRYYAIDKNQKTTHSNADLAIGAVKDAVKHSSLMMSDVQLLATGTTQGDLPIPGFASMVHAGLDIDRCEVASFQSVCASGMMALQSAYAQISSGIKNNAVCVGSELASRMFKASRFEAQQAGKLPFDTEFLRWMLSDGAGALVLQDQPAAAGISLRVEWIDLQSHANKNNLCMYAGKIDNRDSSDPSWLDYDSFEQAASAGAINLKQDIRLLDQVVKTGVKHYFELIQRGMIDSEQIDWLCCHYSSEYFKQPIKDLMEKGGGAIAADRWFSNLPTKGNTGAASIYIMLQELMTSGKLQAGQSILCMVPESGRFITSFMKLTVVQESSEQAAYPSLPIAAPKLDIAATDTAQWLVRQLSAIWINFETDLLRVPIIEKIQNGKLSHRDYKLLLHDLRQQVIDGSQWISRAASNIDIELFELRSAFIVHTAAEHKDYQMLEKNYVNLGEQLEDIQSGSKNIGSQALSSFMFQQASKANPIDLLGAMFIIEGIGKRLAAHWGNMIKDQLNLDEDQVSFFTYHGVADEKHFENLEKALDHPAMNMMLAKQIAKTAKMTAYLWKNQLLELGNY